MSDHLHIFSPANSFYKSVGCLLLYFVHFLDHILFYFPDFLFVIIIVVLFLITIVHNKL